MAVLKWALKAEFNIFSIKYIFVIYPKVKL